jgi:hypothetical protein
MLRSTPRIVQSKGRMFKETVNRSSNVDLFYFGEEVRVDLEIMMFLFFAPFCR